MTLNSCKLYTVRGKIAAHNALARVICTCSADYEVSIRWYKKLVEEAEKMLILIIFYVCFTLKLRCKAFILGILIVCTKVWRYEAYYAIEP